MSGFAVIDVETTGLSPQYHHRIIEIAIVHVDERGVITGRWETLVNPDRDLGPQHIHGIRSTDVLKAPRFDAIAGRLVELLSGRVIVAHNAAFDLRFLEAELIRAGYDAAVSLSTLCTMQLARDLIPGAGRSLADCCSAYDIVIADAHRALADAEATAQLLACYMSDTDDLEFWWSYLDAAQPWPPHSALGAAPWKARAAAAAPADTAFFQRIVERMPDRSGPKEHVDYLALLDRCLIDRHISAHESEALIALADDLGIGRTTAVSLHATYFDDLVTAAWADGVLTPAELADLAVVAALLGLAVDTVAAATTPRAATAETVPTSAFALTRGDAIVLTGTMTRPRDIIAAELEALGYLVGTAITKSTRLLVAADPDSLSGKAKKARQYGVPVVSESALARVVAGRS